MEGFELREASLPNFVGILGFATYRVAVLCKEEEEKGPEIYSVFRCSAYLLGSQRVAVRPL